MYRTVLTALSLLWPMRCRFFGTKPVYSGNSLHTTLPSCNILCDHLTDPPEAEINIVSIFSNLKGILHVNYRGRKEKRKVAALLSIFGVRQI